MPFDFRKPASRRRFRSSESERILRSREYYYSLFTTLAVKIVLFIFLWMLFGSAVGVMRKSFKNVSDAWRMALPGAIAAIALLIGYHIYKNIKEILRHNREFDEARKKSRGA
jgi:flagellar biosynthesis protein FlhB